MFLLGAAVLAFPSASNYFAERNGSQTVQTYADKVLQLGDAEREAAWQAAEEYNQSLTGQPVHDPFLEGSGMAMGTNYEQLLNVDGIMGYIEIPRIGVSLPIYHGSSDSVLQKGAGHLEGSTLPIGGPSRHAVIVGHTGLTTAKLFTDLHELGQGDLFYIRVLDTTLAYEVDQIKVIEPQVTEDLVRFEGKDYVTLLTCTPYGVNSHRLLVRGERVEYRPDVRDAIERLDGSAIDRMVLWAAVGSAAVMGALVVVVIVARKRRKHDDS